MPRNDGWSTGAVRERCTHLRAALQGRASVAAEELAAYWPGGAENSARRGRGAWLYCYASYSRLMGRAEAAKAASATEDALLTALAATPVAVTLTTGAVVHCHPKSYLALRWMAHADTLLGAMLDCMDRIPFLTEERQEDLREQALQGTTQLQLALAWAAGHPGVGLPFDAQATLPAPPDWVVDLTPQDLYRILKGYREANLQGLAALPALTSGAPEGPRPTWAIFFAHRSTESGLAADVLMRERPLAQLLAEARLAAAVHERVGVS